MCSLIECVINDLRESDDIPDEDVLASWDIDAFALSDSDAGWVTVEHVTNPKLATVEDLNFSDFLRTGPSVYEKADYMIVRGNDSQQMIWLVYQKCGQGVAG